jgi:hypothetical protein
VTQLRLVTHFRTNALQVAAVSLGSTLAFTAEPMTAQVKIPRVATDPEFGCVNESVSEFRNGVLIIGLTAFRVVVEGESEWLPGDRASDFGAVNDFTRAAQRQATRVASQFLDIARMKGQYWLGLIGGPGEQVGPAWVETTDGARLPVEVKPYEFTFHATADARYLIPADLSSKAMTDEDVTSEFRRLINDALYLSVHGSGTDLRHGVVLAAVAAEIAIKRALTRLAKPEHEELVNVLLGNFKDFTPSAANLYHTVAGPVLGRSINDEPGGLFQRVQRLFNDRNLLVHRRDRPISSDKCREDIHAGRVAVRWVLAFFETDQWGQ